MPTYVLYIIQLHLVNILYSYILLCETDIIVIAGCRIKVHKEHLDKKEDAIAPCKLHYDPNSARELLLLAANPEDQKYWVSRLSRRVQKCGYKANSHMDGTGQRVSPR